MGQCPRPSTRLPSPPLPTNRSTGVSRACRRIGGGRPLPRCVPPASTRSPPAPSGRCACCASPPSPTTSSTMAAWCRDRGVELAPHGKTHMAPQLLARQFDAGATAVTLATISQVRTFRAFGVDRVVLANELVDEAGLRWLAAELDGDPNFEPGVLGGLGARGRDHVGHPGRRRCPTSGRRLRRGGHGRRAHRLPGRRRGRRRRAGRGRVPAAAPGRRRGLRGRHGARRDPTRPAGGCGPTCGNCGRRWAVWRRRSRATRSLVTAGGSTYFDLVADELTGWAGVGPVRTVLRSGCYLTHDDGLYGRTSPLTAAFRPALSVWAQVTSRPEPDLALVTMGRRDVSFDQDLPVPYGLTDSAVTEAQRPARLPAGGTRRPRSRRGGDVARVRDLPSLHGVRQVAADPGARRRRPGRRPGPHVLLASSRAAGDVDPAEPPADGLGRGDGALGGRVELVLAEPIGRPRHAQRRDDPAGRRRTPVRRRR